MMKTYSREGFSLVELLVVIALLAFLFVLGSAALNRTTVSMDRTRCVSNLQKIGKAIHLYAADNNGILPGPLSGRQRVYTTPYHHTKRPGVGSNRQVSLIDRIAVYIGMNVPPGGDYTRYASDLFYCPAGRKQMVGRIDRETSAKYYFTTLDPNMKPFGYYSSSNEKPPLSLANIPAPAEVMGMADNDCELAPDPEIPLKPSHGTTRNVLFIDGHVEALPLSKFK